MATADLSYVAVAGTIATGKSGLVERLAARLGGEPLREDVDRNPYFGRFYADPGRWAFHSQVAFAVDSLLRLANRPADRPLVQDRTIYESIDVFGAMLGELGHLSPEDLEVLTRLRDAARRLSGQPDVLVYLHAPVNVVLERVAARNREAERSLAAPYLERLERYYERFVDDWDQCPVLSVNSSARDLRDHAELGRLVEEMKAVKEA